MAKCSYCEQEQATINGLCDSCYWHKRRKREQRRMNGRSQSGIDRSRI